MTERPIDVWVAKSRSAWARSPWPGRVSNLPDQVRPGATARWPMHLVPVALVLLVLGIDLVLRQDPPFVLTALLDETAHLATSLVVLAGLYAAGLRLDRVTALGAVLAGNLIDLDHIPQMAGHTWITSSADLRPYTHSVSTIVAVLVLGRLAGRWTTAETAERLRALALGAAIGLTAHFVRDIAGSPTALLWPASTARLEIQYTLYLVTLAAAAGAWWWQVRRRAGSGRHRSSVGEGSSALDRPVPGLQPWASRLVVGLATGAYAWHVSQGMLTRLAHLRLAGFDTGIFVQGVWLLAHGHDPFVTVRGLPLLSDHASFVLLLVAPVYAVLGHPGLLLVAQVVATALAAVALNALFLRSGRVWPATVFPLVYLLHPSQQWGVTFEFHPESLAPALLVLGLHLALHSSRRGWWLLPLVVALTCKEDVSFVVAGMGLLLLLLGRRRRGLVALGVGLAYFLVVTAVVMPALGGGMTSIYFTKNFGIDTHGSALGWVPYLPHIVEMFFTHATQDEGLLYLTLILAPVAFLALLDPKWLVPAAGPVFVNLASQVEELHSIQFHYLLTTVPFVAIAAFHGYLRLTRVLTPVGRRAVLGTLCVVALVLSAERGALPKLAEEGRATPAATREAAERAMAMIPPDAPVSASWNLVPRLAERTRIYDFPVPFDKGWWGTGEPPEELAREVEWVIVRPSTLRDMDRPAYERLLRSPQWQRVVEADDIVLLRRGPGR